MVTYFIAQINIKDNEEYQKYLDGYDGVFDRFRGTVVAVDDDVSVLEGKWSFGRTVIIRFPSERDLLDWYESEEYKNIARHRKNASEGNIVVVHGKE